VPADFYRAAHQILYQVILALYEQRRPADFITLCEELERLGKLKEVGVPMPSPAGECRSHQWQCGLLCRIVAQKALYRRLIHVAGQIAPGPMRKKPTP